MTINRKYSILRKGALVLAFIMFVETFMPTVAMALTSGPAQPEFSSFEPVATTNMVNEFSGDLTYNLPIIEIPGANGGGYAMSLSYHSGTSPEEEASWVGYGWSLNPGAISRNKKGFPDDDNGTQVKFWNKVPDNRTVSVGAGLNIETFSFDPPINMNYSLRYNNYKGFGYSKGVGLQFGKGIVSLGYSVTDGEGSFSVRVNPMASLSKSLKKHARIANHQSKVAASEDKKALARKKSRESKRNQAASNAVKGIGAVSLIGSKYGVFSHSEEVSNLSVTKYTGGSLNFTLSILATPTFLQAGPSLDLSGNYSFQSNQAISNRPVYGYLYSANAPKGDVMMDYYMEKSNPYDKQDKYIGVPFANADMYSLSGEGIGGSFRPYHREAGHFRPNAVVSDIKILNAGAEVEAGLNVGTGADIGVGFQKFSSTDWSTASTDAVNFSNPVGDEPVFFRFTNDQGGYVDYGSDSKQQANVKYKSGGAGNKDFEPNISSLTTLMNSDTRSARSSYVAYHTNEEMELKKNSKSYKAYSLSSDVNKYVNRTSGGGLSKSIGEHAVINEDGNKYVYGLPVYSRNDLNMQYDLQGVSGSSIYNNYIAYKNISSNKSQVGEERILSPYASSYLLTEITSPDYIDKTFNGPSDDDYGGYTRFSYVRKCGTTNKNDQSASADSAWFKWRMPYTGLLYNRGELSTALDDMGSASYGEKEIYYLDTIVTKTHFAVFCTSARYDGRSSLDNSTAANKSSALTGGELSGLKALQKLDRIDLYAKDPNSGTNHKLIKSVRFAYDNSLSTGLPNSSGPTSPETGKLTLKKVWFEYEGVYNAKISPYVFEYAYPTTAYPSKYNALDSAGTGLDQNPVYSPYNIDAWGNYQKDGDIRFGNMQGWLDQTPPSGFDPAAWQLKVIKQPSGGEIHIQYEQDDYKYVQDKWAHAMVRLSDKNDVESSSNKYYIDETDALGSNADTALLRKLINDQYVVTGQKMYFKFLYKLLGASSPDPTLTSCASEYIEGYATVKKVVRETGGAKRLYVVFGPNTIGKHDLPKQLCRDYLTTQRAGNISLGGNCDPDANGVPMNGSPEQIVEGLVGFLSTNLIPGNSEMCLGLNSNLSYLKLPVPFKGTGTNPLRGKKGGGVRVKRLLMYDKGMETGDAALYGSEYVYQLSDGTSSGVTTNEPSSIREENAVIEFDPKNKQTFLNKVCAGRDKEQAERPLGESILPSPSVGYSRVVVKNIHSGKTNTGFIVKEFNTAKEYPVKVDYTEIETQRDYLPIPGGLINYFVSNLWLTQGYVFELNNMHGQPKSETTYRGNPDDMLNASISSQQVFDYYKPGEQVPMMNSLNNVTYSNPGKEEELVFETRGVEDISNDLAIEFDLDVGLAFIPIPFFSIIPSYTYNESKMYSHTTTKVINYPAIVKSTLSYADGIYHRTENMAFNPHTGKPIVTRTTDGFDLLKLNLSSSGHNGKYTAYTFPASQQYPGMGQKSKNERMIIKAGSGQTIKFQDSSPDYLLFEGSGSCDLTSKFCPGDLAKVYKASSPSNYGIFHVTDSLSGNKLYMYETSATNFGSHNMSSNDLVEVEILRSGCTNQLSVEAGHFTTYGDTATVANNPDLTVWNAFVAQLNSALPNGSIPKSSLDANLKIIDIGGQCVSLKDNIMSSGGCIDLDTNVNNDVSMFIRTGADCGTQCENGGAGCAWYNCEIIQLGKKGGVFGLDPVTYDLNYYETPGVYSCGKKIQCVDLCPDLGANRKVNVVSADAQTYADRWTYNHNVYPKESGSNLYENGTKGKWRQQSNYVYRDTIIGANASNQRNYKNAGVFELQTFNWRNSAANDTSKWIKVSTVTNYSPDGNAMEEKDVLGIYSTAKFGYSGTQPYLIAKNASHLNAQFESFEKAYSSGSKLEDGWAPSSPLKRSNYVGHSGTWSWKMSASDSIPLDSMQVNSQILGSASGLVMKVWVRDTANTKAIPVKGALFATSKYLPVTFTKIARTGEWSLFEANVSGTAIDAVFNAGDVIIGRIKNDYSGGHIFIDDVRVQPKDAQMIAYVYDVNTLRLITTFDDQHFGLFYQYNGEGKLLRKQKETEKGLKTITETQYHTPTVNR